MIRATTMLALMAAVLTAAADGRFIDHGVATTAVESRGVACMEDSAGNAVVISLNNDRGERGWLLVTDIDSGETEQVYYPEDVDTSAALAAPFASFVSSAGRFYTGAGGVLLEFDPASREFLWHGRPNPDADLFVDRAMAEGPGGTIYAGTTSLNREATHLISYDPETQTAIDHGQMDPEEERIRFMAVDDAGWVYCGIGTARGNIVAFNPQTGERRQVPPEAERDADGTGWVFESTNGKVYGTVAGKNWRMYEGRGEEIDPSERGPVKPVGVIGWTSSTGEFPDGRALVAHSLQDGWMEIEDPQTGETKRIEFSYEAIGGMGFTSLGQGPDGMIYGSTCHPMRFIRYDPATDEMTDLGGFPGIGNFCAIDAAGDQLLLVSYSDGIMHLYDPARPYTGGQGEAPNPRELTRWPDAICRPRSAVAYPDGRHLLMSGFAGYGLTGGGMGIYDLQTGETELLTHEDLIPNQSTFVLKVLSDGNLVASTDISAPGGGHVLATEAVVYVLDWDTREVILKTAPVPGAGHIRHLTLDPDGRAWGLAQGGVLFVLDLETGEVVHREDFSQYEVERHIITHDGAVYALFHTAIVRLDPSDFSHEVVARPPSPVKVGGPVIDGRLYYTSEAHLWSYELEN